MSPVRGDEEFESVEVDFEDGRSILCARRFVQLRAVGEDGRHFVLTHPLDLFFHRAWFGDGTPESPTTGRLVRLENGWRVEVRGENGWVEVGRPKRLGEADARRENDQ
jgi:hypothetical protein